MSINLVFQIAAIGVIVSILAVVLRQSQREEWAQMLTLAGVVLVLTMVFRMVLDLFKTVRTMFQF